MSDFIAAAPPGIRRESHIHNAVGRRCGARTGNIPAASANIFPLKDALRFDQPKITAVNN